MNYGEIKEYLRKLVNRKDLDDTLAAQFIQQSQTRIERRLRTTAMENYVSFTVDGNSFAVPADFLEIIDLWSGDRELERVDMSRLVRQMNTQGEPTVFLQTGHQIIIRPTPASDLPMYMRYYASQPELITDADENLWTVTAVDALVYGAAELAGDFYEDERLSRFAEKFNTAMLELEEQTIREDFAGPMSITPTYSYPED